MSSRMEKPEQPGQTAQKVLTALLRPRKRLKLRYDILYERLYKRWQPKTWKICERKIEDSDDAADVCSQIWIELWDDLRGQSTFVYQGNKAFGSWALTKTYQHRIPDYFRRRQRQRKRFSEFMSQNDEDTLADDESSRPIENVPSRSSDDPVSCCEVREIQRYLIAAAKQSLPNEKQQDKLELAIALILDLPFRNPKGRSENWIKVNTCRIRKMLKEKLDRWNGSPNK